MWNEVVIATPRASWSDSGTLVATAPSNASELVRVRRPTDAEIRGNAPDSFIRCSSCCVPQVPAARTTCRAVTVLRACRNHAPLRCVVTANPPPGSSRTSLTVRSASITTPRRSARAR